MEDYIFLVILFIVVFAFIIFKLCRYKYILFLQKNSFALKKLCILNDSFNFIEIPNDYNYKHTYDNEKFFNNISCGDYLIYQLQYKSFEILKIINNVKYNIDLYNEYCKEIKLINDFGNYENEGKLNKKYLLILERQLFEKKLLCPKRTFYIKIILYCAKINGTIYKKKRCIFTTNEISGLIERLSNKSNGFYNDKEIWDALCRVERGKVSNKMRFAIYKRDGYRCRYCRRSEKTDYLEIDHIKPIAKGGKSTYDNLQTLCRRCNKIKGDKY